AGADPPRTARPAPAYVPGGGTVVASDPRSSHLPRLRRPCSGATQVATVAGVDFDLLAGGDEQRYLHRGTRLHRRRLRATGGPGALRPPLAVGDLPHHAGRQLHVPRLTRVGGHHHLGCRQQVVGGVADRGRGDRQLVVGLQVHEHVVLAVGVQLLHVPLVYGRRVDFDDCVEGPVHHLARAHVLQGGPHERSTLARLDVQELHDGPQLAVEVENHAVLQIVSGGHTARSLFLCVVVDVRGTNPIEFT